MTVNSGCPGLNSPLTPWAAFRDEGGDAEPQRVRVDDGGVPAQRPRLLEPAHPVVNARRRQADLPSEVGVRRPGVGHQGREQLAVDVVHLTPPGPS